MRTASKRLGRSVINRRNRATRAAIENLETRVLLSGTMLSGYSSLATELQSSGTFTGVALVNGTAASSGTYQYQGIAALEFDPSNSAIFPGTTVTAPTNLNLTLLNNPSGSNSSAATGSFDVYLAPTYTSMTSTLKYNTTHTSPLPYGLESQAGITGTAEVDTLTPATHPTAGDVYTIGIAGTTVSYTVAASDTPTKVVTGLTAAWNANATLKALATPSGSSTMVLTAKSLGAMNLTFTAPSETGATLVITTPTVATTNAPNYLLGNFSVPNSVNAVAEVDTLTPTDTTIGHVYSIGITGYQATYTVKSGDTASNIVAGLSAAWTANATLSALANVTGTSTMIVTGVTANQALNLTCTDQGASVVGTQLVITTAAGGVGVAPVAEVDTFTPQDWSTGDIFNIGIPGTGAEVTHTVVGSDSANTIVSALATAWNANSILSAVAMAGGTNTLVLTAAHANEPMNISQGDIEGSLNSVGFFSKVVTTPAGSTAGGFFTIPLTLPSSASTLLTNDLSTSSPFEIFIVPHTASSQAVFENEYVRVTQGTYVSATGTYVNTGMPSDGSLNESPQLSLTVNATAENFTLPHASIDVNANANTYVGGATNVVEVDVQRNGYIGDAASVEFTLGAAGDIADYSTDYGVPSNSYITTNTPGTSGTITGGTYTIHFAANQSVAEITVPLTSAATTSAADMKFTVTLVQGRTATNPTSTATVGANPATSTVYIVGTSNAVDTLGGYTNDTAGNAAFTLSSSAVNVPSTGSAAGTYMPVNGSVNNGPSDFSTPQYDVLTFSASAAEQGYNVTNPTSLTLELDNYNNLYTNYYDSVANGLVEGNNQNNNTTFSPDNPSLSNLNADPGVGDFNVYLLPGAPAGTFPSKYYYQGQGSGDSNGLGLNGVAGAILLGTASFSNQNTQNSTAYQPNGRLGGVQSLYTFELSGTAQADLQTYLNTAGSASIRLAITPGSSGFAAEFANSNSQTGGQYGIQPYLWFNAPSKTQVISPESVAVAYTNVSCSETDSSVAVDIERPTTGVIGDILTVNYTITAGDDEVDMLTPNGTINIGDVYSIGTGSTFVSYTAQTGDTAAAIVTQLISKWQGNSTLNSLATVSAGTNNTLLVTGNTVGQALNLGLNGGLGTLTIVNAATASATPGVNFTKPYGGSYGTVTFAKGQSVATLLIPIINSGSTVPESFSIELTSASASVEGAVTGANLDTIPTTVTIVPPIAATQTGLATVDGAIEVGSVYTGDYINGSTSNGTGSFAFQGFEYLNFGPTSFIQPGQLMTSLTNMTIGIPDEDTVVGTNYYGPPGDVTVYMTADDTVVTPQTTTYYNYFTTAGVPDGVGAGFTFVGPGSEPGSGPLTATTETTGIQSNANAIPLGAVSFDAKSGLNYFTPNPLALSTLWPVPFAEATSLNAAMAGTTSTDTVHTFTNPGWVPLNTSGTASMLTPLQLFMDQINAGSLDLANGTPSANVRNSTVFLAPGDTATHMYIYYSVSTAGAMCPVIQATDSVQTNQTSESVSFLASTYNVDNGGGNIVIPVSRSILYNSGTGLDDTLTVSYSMADGTAVSTAGGNYVSQSGTLTFAPGQTTADITVAINSVAYSYITGASNLGGAKAFTITLTNPANVAISDGSTYSVGTNSTQVTYPATTSDSLTSVLTNLKNNWNSTLNVLATATISATNQLVLTAVNANSPLNLSIPAGVVESLAITTPASSGVHEVDTLTIRTYVAPKLGAISTATVFIVDNPNNASTLDQYTSYISEVGQNGPVTWGLSTVNPPAPTNFSTTNGTDYTTLDFNGQYFNGAYNQPVTGYNNPLSFTGPTGPLTPTGPLSNGFPTYPAEDSGQPGTGNILYAPTGTITAINEITLNFVNYYSSAPGALFNVYLVPDTSSNLVPDAAGTAPDPHYYNTNATGNDGVGTQFDTPGGSPDPNAPSFTTKLLLGTITNPSTNNYDGYIDVPMTSFNNAAEQVLIDCLNNSQTSGMFRLVVAPQKTPSGSLDMVTGSQTAGYAVANPGYAAVTGQPMNYYIQPNVSFDVSYSAATAGLPASTLPAGVTSSANANYTYNSSTNVLNITNGTFNFTGQTGVSSSLQVIVNGAFTGTGTGSVNQLPSVVFNSDETLGSLTLENGATASFGVNSLGNSFSVTTNSLTVDSSSQLDLGKGQITINYTAGNSPLATVKSLIVNGFNGGAWTGTSGVGNIISSALQSGGGTTDTTHSVGFYDNGNGQVIARYTLKGDTYCIGTVNYSSLLALAQNYDTTGVGDTWATGDFNYAYTPNGSGGYIGTVGFADLVAMAQTYGQSAVTTASQVQPAVSFAQAWSQAETAATTTVGPATQLAFTIQPGSVDTAGGNLGDIAVSVQDANGKVVSSNNSTVTLSIASGPRGATLAGTVTAKVVDGVATFSNLSISKAGVYTFKAVDAKLKSATSSSFTVDAATAAKLVFIDQPKAITVSGSVFAPPVELAVEDAYGNIVTDDDSPVSVLLNSGPKDAILKGTATVDAVNGVATFADLSLVRTGTFTLKAKAGALSPVASNWFNIVSPPVTTSVKVQTAGQLKAASSVASSVLDLNNPSVL